MTKWTLPPTPTSTSWTERQQRDADGILRPPCNNVHFPDLHVRPGQAPSYVKQKTYEEEWNEWCELIFTCVIFKLASFPTPFSSVNLNAKLKIYVISSRIFSRLWYECYLCPILTVNQKEKIEKKILRIGSLWNCLHFYKKKVFFCKQFENILLFLSLDPA